MFTFVLAEFIWIAVADWFVSAVTRQLKSGLYSKSNVYTANPTLGTVLKVRWKAKLIVEPNCEMLKPLLGPNKNSFPEINYLFTCLNVTIELKLWVNFCYDQNEKQKCEYASSHILTFNLKFSLLIKVINFDQYNWTGIHYIYFQKGPTYY